jgi:hypothetical protein
VQFLESPSPALTIIVSAAENNYVSKKAGPKNCTVVFQVKHVRFEEDF